MQALAKVWVPNTDAWSNEAKNDPDRQEWRTFKKELSEPVLQRVLPPMDLHEGVFLDMCNPWAIDKPELTQIETNVFSNILQVCPQCLICKLPAHGHTHQQKRCIHFLAHV